MMLLLRLATAELLRQRHLLGDKHTAEQNGWVVEHNKKAVGVAFK